MMSKKKRKLQVIVFDRGFFNSKKAIKEWLKKKDYEIPKYRKKPIKKFDDEFRVRIREPFRFNKKTFRRKKVRRGVYELTGFLK